MGSHCLRKHIFVNITYPWKRDGHQELEVGHTFRSVQSPGLQEMVPNDGQLGSNILVHKTRQVNCIQCIQQTSFVKKMKIAKKNVCIFYTFQLDRYFGQSDVGRVVSVA